MTTRREFLVRVAGIGAALSLPELLHADPYRPFALDRATARPLRVRGRVVSGQRPVRGARVSDGRAVVRVDADGRFDFVTTDAQRYLTVCPPTGYALPTSRTGTVQLYTPLPRTGGEMTHQFELTARPDRDDGHSFLVLADPQTENDFEMQRFHAETVPDVLQTRQSLGDRSVFGVGCGDLMYDHLEMYPEYERAVWRMGIPFAQVVGNHDLNYDARTTEDATATFQRHFGAPNLSFDMGQVHYLVLNDVFWHGAGYIGYLTEEQLEWVKQDLALVEPGRTVIVFLHIPVVSSQYERVGERAPGVGTSLTNRQALYRLLEGHRAHIIAGHTHESEHRTEGTIHEHVSGAVCGAWWSGDICFDGTPNGYGVYDVDGERVSWRYKATGQDAKHQMRLYAPGSDGTAPGDLVANVWDWDPSWTVRWFEDGQPRGVMSRRRGVDPLSVTLHRGDSLPARRTWVEPMVTNHLFYAAASPGAREWRVDARDGSGRSYSETLRAS
jgi:C terminal of Calcineurin-like phosphoesterase/N terminal of Calcineurin-like phosphoesterase/Calcineurin-like phosphoesterase